MVQYKGVMLTHAPIHPRELEHRFPVNIHGHIHDSQVMLDHWTNIPDKRYICVSCERVGFSPKTLEELGIFR
jgi:predicted phosphohydrolase